MKLTTKRLKKLIREELNKTNESKEKTTDYHYGSDDQGRAYAAQGQHPPVPDLPPEEPKQDPLKFSFQGTALHQFFDGEYMMTPLSEIPVQEINAVIRNIVGQYLEAVREKKSEGFINSFFNHTESVGEWIKTHPEATEAQKNGIDNSIARIQNKMRRDRERIEKG